MLTACEKFDIFWTDMSVQKQADRKTLKRSLFLQAARKIFAQKGFQTANVTDIVAEVNSGQGTFYYHFKDKQAIFDELMIGFIEKLVQTVIENDIRGSGKLALADRELAIRNAKNIASVFLDDIDLASLFFRESKYVGGEAMALIEQSYNLIYAQIEKGLEEGKKLGLVRPEIDSRIVARCFAGATERVIFETICADGAVDLDAVAAQIVDFQSLGVLSGRADYQAQAPAQKVENIV
jgi:AcrR family transcriptional regulator